MPQHIYSERLTEIEAMIDNRKALGLIIETLLAFSDDLDNDRRITPRHAKAVLKRSRHLLGRAKRLAS